MKYSEATKALVAAILNGETLQVRDKVTGDGEAGTWADDTMHSPLLIEQIMQAERVNGEYEWRVKPQGKHLYTLVIRDRPSGRIVLMPNREEMKQARQDRFGIQNDRTYEPLYYIHHEFDPEDGSLRSTNVIMIANEAAS